MKFTFNHVDVTSTESLCIDDLDFYAYKILGRYSTDPFMSCGFLYRVGVNCVNSWVFGEKRTGNMRRTKEG